MCSSKVRPLATDLPAPKHVSVRVQASVYCAAAFSNTMPNIAWVVMPIWLYSLETPSWLIGIAIGCRHVGPVMLAIHGGAMMDRFGARRVMIALALVGALVPLLYPVAPYIGAILLFQLVTGLADSLGWVGAQALVGQTMRGEAKYASRMSFATRVGLLTGPPLAGLGWDYFGPWGGFGMVALWSSGLLLSVILLPAFDVAVADRDRPAGSAGPTRPTLRELMPRLSDYTDAFRLLLVPAMAFVMIMSLLRHIGGGIQGSFYGVFLSEIGISATMIGLFISAMGLFGLIGSLSVTPLLRVLRAQWLLLVMVLASIIFIVITPLLRHEAEFLLSAGVRGWALAASLALLISLISGNANQQEQGKAMGLRVTLNQIVWFLVPVIVGFLAELVGIPASFYICGGFALLLVILAGVWAHRANAFDRD
jgi:MFS family permease